MRKLLLGTLLAMTLAAIAVAARRGAAPTEPPPPRVPWEQCRDVTIAPADATPLAWRACGDGCEELAVDGAHRVFGVQGATAADGTHWLGFVRDRDDAGHELDVYHLPDAAPAFAARMTKGFSGDCLVRLRAMGDRGALVDASFRDATGARLRLVSEQPRGALVAEDRAEHPVLETVFAGGVRAQTTTRRSIEIGGTTRWEAPAGTLVANLVGTDGGIAFTALTGDHSAVSRLAPDGTVQTLARDAGAPASDGRDLVWFARDPDGTAALFARGGRRLRAAHQDYVDDGRGVVGDGYALHVERARAEVAGTLIVTHLADGETWTIPPRPGTRWGTPLWIDRDELAVVLDPDADAVRAGAIAYGEASGIARITYRRAGSRASSTRSP